MSEWLKYWSSMHTVYVHTAWILCISRIDADTKLFWLLKVSRGRQEDHSTKSFQSQQDNSPKPLPFLEASLHGESCWGQYVWVNTGSRQMINGRCWRRRKIVDGHTFLYPFLIQQPKMDTYIYRERMCVCQLSGETYYICESKSESPRLMIRAFLFQMWSHQSSTFI